jgi:hypothetical protein
MRVLEWLAKACALLAGVLLTAITLMTCASVMGRNTTGWTLVGDFELSGARPQAPRWRLFMPLVPATGVAMSSWTSSPQRSLACHAAQRWTVVGALLLAGCHGACMAWRSTLGGLNAWKSSNAGLDDAGLSGVDRLLPRSCRRWLLTAVIALAQALGASAGARACTHDAAGAGAC